MRAVVPWTARQFARAIVMPNLAPPVTTTALAAAYRERIAAAVPEGIAFTPLMTAYLTDESDPDDLAAGFADGVLTAAKLYPAGATTNSASGVTDVAKIRTVLEAMADIGMVLCVHGEATGPEVDVFDRERVFIERTLSPLVRRFPGLKVVFEHITTAEAAQFVRAAGAHVAATVTAHHLLLNRNAIFAGGIRPHHYCLPVLKRESHREALVSAVTSGNPRFFLGTDSAPHAQSTKENACGCAGCYTAHAGIELYAEVFDAAGALERLEAFASLNGPAFYGLAPNADTITLRREAWSVPASYPYLGGDALVPLRAGEQVGWRLIGAGDRS